MKKTFIIPVIVVVAFLLFFYYRGNYSGNSSPKESKNKTNLIKKDSKLLVNSKLQNSIDTTLNKDKNNGEAYKGNAYGDDIESDSDLEEDYRPATEIYTDATQAFTALSQAAKTYDDIVLEQFVNLGDNCSWCDELYDKVKNTLLNTAIDEDEKSFYAEVLAVSGRKENIATLIDAIKNSNGDDAEIFAEALEVAEGGDEVVDFLKSYLDSGNELLQEAAVAAITNQTTLNAAQVLYEHTVKKGDPDGYYSLGLGLGEFFPDDNVLPYLRSLAVKRDEYSHLAVKALLNQGLDGLKIVFDLLETSQNPSLDKENLRLKEAVDHVYYEDDIADYVKRVLKTSKSPVAIDFARDILKDFGE